MIRVGNTALDTNERADVSILISMLAKSSGNIVYRGQYTWIESGVELLVAAVLQNYCNGKSNSETVTYSSGSILIEVTVKQLKDGAAQIINAGLEAENQGEDFNNLTLLVLQLRKAVEALSSLVIKL